MDLRTLPVSEGKFLICLRKNSCQKLQLVRQARKSTPNPPTIHRQDKNERVKVDEKHVEPASLENLDIVTLNAFQKIIENP